MASPRRDRPGLTPRQARARYRRIVWFGFRFLAVMWWTEVLLPKVGLGGLSRRGRDERMRRWARRFHGLALYLGGLMIKVGQFVSTRMDVLPPEITRELEGLQDEVPPEPFEAVRAAAEVQLGRPLAAAYAWFDPEPLAAASLGQAHRARLTPTLAADAGFTDVVVKVQRPGIDTVVEVDLAALRKLAGWVSHVGFVAARMDIRALVEEFAVTSLDEVDYLHEAVDAERFAAAFAHDPRVECPAVAWERSSPKLLTLQDVSAITISDTAALRAAGIDPAQVADELARVSLEQLFDHGFFHADPHPGNLFVTPHADGTWAITFIDFGMMGEIPDELRADLRRLVVAIVARDSKAMVKTVQEVGLLLPGGDADELEEVMAHLFDRFGGMSVPDMARMDPAEVKEFTDRFGDTLRTTPVQLPENFLWLFRAVSLISGVCTTLNPDFNMWLSVEPFAAPLTRSQGVAAAKDAATQALSTATVVAGLPRRLDDVLYTAQRGRLAVQIPQTDGQLRLLRRSMNRISAAAVFVGLILAGALVRHDSRGLSDVLMLASAAPLLFVLVSGLRR